MPTDQTPALDTQQPAIPVDAIRAAANAVAQLSQHATAWQRASTALKAAAPLMDSHELEQRASQAVERALQLAKELDQLAERHAALQRLHDLWQRSAQNRLRDLTAARDEIRRQDTLFDTIADTATLWTRAKGDDPVTTFRRTAGQDILQIIERHRGARGARGLGSSRRAQDWVDEDDVERYARFIAGHPDAALGAVHLAAARAVLGALVTDGRLLPAEDSLLPVPQETR